MYSSRPNLPCVERNVARIVPVGDVDVVILQQGLHGAAQQRREMAGHRRHQQHPRLLRRIFLLEMQQRAERRRVGDFLGDLQFAVAHQHLVDAVGRARIGQRRARDQFQRRGEPPEQFVGDALRDEVEIFQRRRGPGPPWRRQVHVVLIGLIHHRHHPDSAPAACCHAISKPKRSQISLANWHVACCMKCVKHKQWALCGGRLGSGARMARASVIEGKAIWRKRH